MTEYTHFSVVQCRDSSNLTRTGQLGQHAKLLIIGTPAMHMLGMHGLVG